MPLNVDADLNQDNFTQAHANMHHVLEMNQRMKARTMEQERILTAGAIKVFIMFTLVWIVPAALTLCLIAYLISSATTTPPHG